MALSEFSQAYMDNLKDLTTPDRRSIVTLKDLAFENISEANGVISAIRQHIKQCPAAHRVAALYLVDCMLKSEPCHPVYAAQINESLPEIFMFLWDQADSSARAALKKVCNLWRAVPVLDQKVVYACDAHMVSAGRTLPFRGMPAVGGVPPSGKWTHGVSQDPHERPATALDDGPSFEPQMLINKLHTHQMAVPSASLQISHTCRPSYHAIDAQPLLLPFQAYVQPQIAYVISHSRPQAQARYPTVPTQEAIVGPQLLGMHAAENQNIPSTIPQQGSFGPHLSLQTVLRPPSTEFPRPQVMKDLDSGAVRELIKTSVCTRPAFLDAEFLRNKRRANKASCVVGTRQWFPSVDLWLPGTTASVHISDAGDQVLKGASLRMYFVDEDPSQPECAISGELFERFYDPDSDKWCYKDAVILSGGDAVKYKVMDGSIVKVHCLATADPSMQLADIQSAHTSLCLVSATSSAAGGNNDESCSHIPPRTSTHSAACISPQPIQPHVSMKEEYLLSMPVVAMVGPGGSLSPWGHGEKRTAEPGGLTLGAPVGVLSAGTSSLPETKRVKLEAL